MSVTINMYNFNKKLNSTKTPDNTVSYDTYECYFLDSQSILNPVLKIVQPNANRVMMEYTYAYIPDLDRYYFISNIVVSDAKIYTYYLNVDVLGTYKNGLLGTTQYVLRSSNIYNDDLVDTIYPIIPMPSGSQSESSELVTQNTIKALNNKTGVWADKNFFHVNYTDGAILFGITGQGSLSADNYVTTVSKFKTFINNVVTAVPTGGSWGNLPTGVQTALSNFLQYITYVKWIPFFPIVDNLGSLVTTVYLGDQAFSLDCYHVEPGLNNQPLRFTLTVPDHPLYSQHKYYNLNPYREVNLFYYPIGNIPIDTTKLVRDSNIASPAVLNVNLIVDLSSGDTEYTITRSGDTSFTTALIANGTTNIAVPLSLTEYSMSVEAALASSVSYLMANSINEWIEANKTAGTTAISSTGASLVHRDRLPGTFGIENLTNKIQRQQEESFPQVIAESIYDAVKNIIDLSPIANALGSFASFAASSFGQATTTGSTGSFLMSVCTTPLVYCWYKKHTAEDYDKFGRPCSESVLLSNIIGFCVCRGADYKGEGNKFPLKPEVESINKLLNSGIYIEEV